MKTLIRIAQIIPLPVFTLALFFFLAGCATTVPVKTERLPNLNTAGVSRIAVMPFKTASDEKIYRDIAIHAAKTANARIKEMNFFTVIESDEIDRLTNSGQNLGDNVDALFSGEIKHIRVDSDEHETVTITKTDEDETEVVFNSVYRTRAELEFNYYITFVRDGRIAGPLTVKGSKRLSAVESIPSPESMLAGIVDEQFKFLGRDLAPYTIIENRALAKEKIINDSTLKAKMKDAQMLVKAGNYLGAIDSYLGIYETYKSLAAAKNAVTLYEAMEHYESAVTFMQKVVRETGEQTARETLARLMGIVRDQEVLTAEYAR